MPKRSRTSSRKRSTKKAGKPSVSRSVPPPTTLLELHPSQTAIIERGIKQLQQEEMLLITGKQEKTDKKKAKGLPGQGKTRVAGHITRKHLQNEVRGPMPVMRAKPSPHNAAHTSLLCRSRKDVATHSGSLSPTRPRWQSITPPTLAPVWS